MNALDLMQYLGQLDDYLIQEADLEEGDVRKRLPHRRPMFIAAVIALALLLVGCTVVCVRRLRDQQIGQFEVTSPILDEEGYLKEYGDIRYRFYTGGALEGTPQYRAAKEWLEFKREYDPDSAIEGAYYLDPDSEEYPDLYDAYRPYSQEVVEKLDELARKYDLKLLGPVTYYDTAQELEEGVGRAPLLRPKGKLVFSFSSGYRYAEGNYGCTFELTGVDGKEKWPPLMWGSFQYHKKDCLDMDMFREEANKKFRERSYTTASGEEVWIVEFPEDYYALVYCDREDATIELLISTLQKPIGDSVSQHLTDRQLEMIIDAFDFG